MARSHRSTSVGSHKPHNHDVGWAHYDPLTESPAKRSVPKALAMAGAQLADVSQCQLYDCYTYTVITTLEDYGFCAKGEGGPFAASGAIGRGGSLPTNTGGGAAFVLLHVGDDADLGGDHSRPRTGWPAASGNQLILVSGNGGHAAASLDVAAVARGEGMTEDAWLPAGAAETTAGSTPGAATAAVGAAPFFAGAREGKLRLQRCRACGTWAFPLRTRCQACARAPCSGVTPPAVARSSATPCCTDRTTPDTRVGYRWFWRRSIWRKACVCSPTSSTSTRRRSNQSRSPGRGGVRGARRRKRHGAGVQARLAAGVSPRAAMRVRLEPWTRLDRDAYDALGAACTFSA